MIGRITQGFDKYVPLLLRLTLSAVFLYHGSDLLFGITGEGGLANAERKLVYYGFSPGKLWLALLVGGEILGAIFLFMGFLTRYAAAVLATIMALEAIIVHLPHGFDFRAGGVEYVMTLFVVALVLVILGGGECSIDNKTGQKERV